jgi:hypothetical protein
MEVSAPTDGGVSRHFLYRFVVTDAKSSTRSVISFADNRNGYFAISQRVTRLDEKQDTDPVNALSVIMTIMSFH